MNDRMDASVAHSTASAGRQRRNNFYSDPENLGQEWRRLLAEFVGTFALTFVAAGGAVFAAAGHRTRRARRGSHGGRRLGRALQPRRHPGLRGP